MFYLTIHQFTPEVQREGRINNPKDRMMHRSPRLKGGVRRLNAFFGHWFGLFFHKEKGYELHLINP